MRSKVFIVYFLFLGHFLFCQIEKTDIGDIYIYLQRIEALLDKQSLGKIQEFDEKALLAQRSNTEKEKRILACLDLFSYYIYKSTELAKNYNDEAYQLSLKTGFQKGRLKASLNQAFIFFVQGEFDDSATLLFKIESENELEKYPEVKADCETFKSYIFTERGEYDIALETSLKILELGEDIENPYILMRANAAISHVYLRLGEYEKALLYCLKGLDFVLELEKARYVFPKLDEIARMTHRLYGSARASEIYEFYLQMEKKVPGPGSYIQSIVYMNIASIYIEEREFLKAEGFLLNALELINSNNYRFRKPRVFILMAELQMKMRDTLGTIKSYHKGLDAAKDIEAYDVIQNISRSLALLYKVTGDTVQASIFSDLYSTISDSLFSVETEQRIKILEARRRINEISKQKEILEIQTEAQETRYRYMLLVLMLLLFSAGGAAYSYYKVKRKNRLLFYRTKELTVEKINNKRKGGNKKEMTSESLTITSRAHENYIDDYVKEIILKKLDRFEETKFFLNPKCSLHNLAEELQTNQKYLSQVINHEKKLNFNNYINGLRIDHLLNRLVEDKEYRNSKLSYISATSGFNNLNTFYSAFKKRLGILPSYFIDQLNQEEA